MLSFSLEMEDPWRGVDLPFGEVRRELLALDVRCADKDHSGYSASKARWLNVGVPVTETRRELLALDERCADEDHPGYSASKAS